MAFLPFFSSFTKKVTSHDLEFSIKYPTLTLSPRVMLWMGKKQPSGVCLGNWNNTGLEQHVANIKPQIRSTGLTTY